jgi:two-component system OmpR family sensor kinase
VNQAFDAQQEADDRLRAFVADASHELRTPLTTASGWIELYLQGGLTDPARRDHAMQRAQSELDRMRTLIDELAMLARLDAARPLELERLDLSALAIEVVDDARVANPDRTITLFASGQAPLRGDRRKLQQVLVNLVGNAVQYSQPGTPVEVTVAPASTSGGGLAYTLLVTDHGPGIPPADQAHVFERFWRGEASRDRHTGGSGLGLSIVASIITAHGGTYGLSSRIGEGTTLRVTLPGLDPRAGSPRPDPVALSGSSV